MQTGTTAELIKAIETHQLDGAFVGGFHQNAALTQEEVFEEELVLVSSKAVESLPALIEKIPQQTVLVFRTGTTDGQLASAKLEVLDRLPVRVLGAVLNDVPSSRAYRYYSYLPGYETGHEEADEAPRQLQSV